VDAGDTDPATFFHYLGLAAKHAAPRYRRPLPHLTPEFLPGLRTFSRRVFEELFRRLRAGTVLVLDNVQDAGAESSLYELLRIRRPSRLLFSSAMRTASSPSSGAMSIRPGCTSRSARWSRRSVRA
jgi:hypothetical protein